MLKIVGLFRNLPLLPSRLLLTHKVTLPKPNYNHPFHDLNAKSPQPTHTMPPETRKQKVSDADEQKVSDADKQEVSDTDKQKVPDIDQQDLSDADAEADEWDDAEYERQMRVTLTKVYSAKHTNEVRAECKKRDLRIWGHKHLLVERIVNYEIQKQFAWGAGEAIGAEETTVGEEATGGEEAPDEEKK